MSKAKTTVTVASAAALALATVSVKKWEGYAPTVVPDRLANGLPTGGYGETVGVKLGETHTKEFWSARLAGRLADDYDAGIGRCIHVDLPDGVRAMAISTAYNAGVGAVCASPMVRRWNAGDVRGGCEAMRTWRVVSHPHGPNGPAVVVRGLQNRRADEARQCLAAIDKPAASSSGSWCSGSGQGPVDCPREYPAKPAPAPARKVEAKPAASSGFLCWIFKCGGKA